MSHAQETWPFTLPQAMLTAAYGEAFGDGIIKDDYNLGPPRYRRRTTSAPRPVSGTMIMTTAEWEQFSAFFGNALFDGALPFLFPPQGSTDTSRFWICRFEQPPSRQMSDADDIWIVSLNMVRLGIGESMLNVALFTDPDIVYQARIVYDQTLTSNIYNDADTIYSPTIPVDAFIVISFAEIEANT